MNSSADSCRQRNGPNGSSATGTSNLTPDEFLAKFTTWSRRVLPGARELLEELRPRYRLAALSNSNELHWERNDERAADHRAVRVRHFVAPGRVCANRIRTSSSSRSNAHTSRRRKPIVFFDDLAANVEAAKSAGMRAYQVRGVDELREQLENDGLLVTLIVHRRSSIVDRRSRRGRWTMDDGRWTMTAYGRIVMRASRVAGASSCPRTAASTRST